MTATATERAPSGWPEGALYSDRFWSHVDRRSEDECWEWKISRTKKGYGQFQVNKKVGPKRAHRVAYLLTHGVDPGDLKVLHQCDNPPCCNPKHLFLGTQADNVRDMHSKGRQGTHVPDALRGADNPCAKLVQEQADEIKRLYATGEYRQVDLAKMFGIKQPRVSQIVRGVCW